MQAQGADVFLIFGDSFRVVYMGCLSFLEILVQYPVAILWIRLVFNFRNNFS